MRDLLRDRDFRLLFTGQSLSMFGDMAMLIVLAMWAKELTGSNGSRAACSARSCCRACWHLWVAS